MSELRLTDAEKEDIRANVKALLAMARPYLHPGDISTLKRLAVKCEEDGAFERDCFGLHPLVMALRAAVLLCSTVAVDRTLLIAMLLHSMSNGSDITSESIRRRWGDDVAVTSERMIRVSSLYRRHASAESENFKRLLLTFAEDIRVIIMIIVGRLSLLQSINRHPRQDEVLRVAAEARYLYAPLAHRLGLYAIKGELEDLSLKYSDRQIYTSIARKLNETKESRQRYIANFIEPVRRRLEKEGLKFEIKGRTKSIFSIWNKIRKQRTDIDHIYDLFAIRIIIDVEPEREKQACWLAYSVITDMFRPNPARMKDWISIPKANGYESLHTTVYGPDDRWVEVQIRTRRMDEIAEKGLAAHWKYKGIKAENGLDAWMGKIRDILETAEEGPLELMKNHKMDVYSKEVFVFTPKGDLFNLPAGATLLDFAFNIHTDVGSRCTGGLVNGKARKINYRLESGDTVEISTSSVQKPKQGWLDFAVTSKARNKIRAAIKEQESHDAEYGKELLQRRLKNRKTEIDEAELTKIIRKLNFKNATEFFRSLGNGELDVNTVVETHVELTSQSASATAVSADEYVMQNAPEQEGSTGESSDVLVIGDNIKGINYRLAKCCSPIYGDDVFGFVSAEGVVKIHRCDCPNAANIRAKYPYRIIRTRWSGSFEGQMAATLRIVGNDDIGIVTNITSVITNENKTSLRNISIDSHDRLFDGYVVVGVRDNVTLNNLIKKIKNIKGVKNVQRAN